MTTKNEMTGPEAVQIRKALEQHEQIDELAVSAPDDYANRVNSAIADYINTRYHIDIELTDPDGEIEIIEGKVGSSLYGENVYVSAQHTLREAFHSKSYYMNAKKDIARNFYQYIDEYITEKEPMHLLENPADDKITRIISNFEDWLMKQTIKSWAEAYIQELKDVQGIRLRPKSDQNA